MGNSYSLPRETIQFFAKPLRARKSVKDVPIHAILGRDELSKPQARNRVLASMTRVPDWVNAPR